MSRPFIVIVLGVSKKALKMVFGVCSIRVFSKISLDPYYEPPYVHVHTYKHVCVHNNNH